MRKENLAILLQDGSDNRNNKSFVLEVLKQYGILLGYASDELRNDKEVVLAAVQNDCDALKYASEELKNDKEVVLTAIKSEWYNGPVMQSTPKYGFSFQQASEEIKKIQPGAQGQPALRVVLYDA